MAPPTHRARRDTVEALCRRIFDCFSATERADTFGDAVGSTVADCTNQVARECTTNAPMCTTLNRSLADSCLTAVSAVTCAALRAGALQLPRSCDDACPLP